MPWVAAKHMTTDKIKAELIENRRIWHEIRSDDEGHGGSPGEGYHERIGELEYELLARGAKP